jgi:hypothetical protein
MRRLFAVVSGALAASLVLLLVGVIANAINPTPPELMDPKTPEEVARRVASATTFTWISTIGGLALGAFFGGVLGALIAREKVTRITWLIGLVLSLWAFYTFYIVFPAVLWVPAIMLISVFLFSYLGGRVVSRNPGQTDN